MRKNLILITLILTSLIIVKVQNTEYEDNKKIIKYTTQQLKDYPSELKYYLARAEAKYYIGDFKGALEDCNYYISQNKINGYAYFNRGIIKKALQDFNGSSLDFSKAIEYSNENLSEIYFSWATVYHDLKKYPKAIQDYKEALKHDKSNVSAYNNLGLLYNETLKFKEAIEVLNNAISLDRTKPNLFYNRAYSKIKLMIYSEAEEDSTNALKLDPGNGFANNYMALNLFNQSKISEACKYYQKAKKKNVKLEIQTLENCE